MAKSKKTRHPGIYIRDDGRYMIRPTAKCSRTGRVIEIGRKTLPIGATEVEALIAVAKAKAKFHAEGGDGGEVKPTLRIYSKVWLKQKSRRLREMTLKRYAHVLAYNILPALGDLRVDRIRQSHVKDWVAWAETVVMEDGRPYAQETVRGWWRVLTNLLKDMVVEYQLRQDPTARVKSPSRAGEPRREKRTLTAEELWSFLNELRVVSEGRYTEALVLGYTGMRPSELYRLEWDDIDEANRKITIRRSAKTHVPREAALPELLARALRAHRREMIVTQHRGLHSGLVFPSNKGTLRHINSMTKPFTLAARRSGTDVRVGAQVLRRTFNTLLRQDGVDRIVLRSQMGHSSEAMTQRYSGVAVEEKLTAVRAILPPDGR